MTEKLQPKHKKFGVMALLIMFILIFSLLLWRFFIIQIRGEASGQKLEEKINQVQMKSEVIQASRGSIYDMHGGLIAGDTVSYRLVAVLSPEASKGLKKNEFMHVVDEKKTATILAKYIDLSEEKILQILSKKMTSGKKEIYQVEFGNKGQNLSRSTKEAISEYNLPGIIFIAESNRYYQNGYFASHVIGYTSKDDETMQSTGVMGLEKYYNEYLTEKNGLKKYPTDHKGNIFPDAVAIVTSPDSGNNIYTTINKNIQTLLESLMTKVDEEFTPEKMFAIVVDPKTGEVMAMSQRPSFNLETREGINSNWNNVIVEESIEPGSTFKIFTWAAAVNEKVFDPNETFMSGTYNVVNGEPPIRDHNKGAGWGEISFLKGLQVSSNVGFTKLGMEKLGTEKMLEYMYDFGFGSKTGIDLPREVNSKFVYNYKREQANTMFGQGTAVTPIQIVQAATAIANEGKMMKPYLVNKIVDPETNEIVYKANPKVVSKPITEQTAKETLQALETVVSDPDGTGKLYKLSDSSIAVAGKTGTAQLPKQGGGYQSGYQNYLFSFLGMAPAENPELLVYVAVQKPKLTIHQTGSVPVSNIFVPLMEQSLRYLSINKKSSASIVDFVVDVPDFSDTSDIGLFKELYPENELVQIGATDLKVVAQNPQPGVQITVGEKLIVVHDGEAVLPNLIGWSARDLQRLTSVLNINITSSGEGFIVEQSYEPGTPLRDITNLNVILTGGETILPDSE